MLSSRLFQKPTAESPDAPQERCLDKGYDDDEVGEWLEAWGCKAHSQARGVEAQALKQGAGYKARR